MIRALIFDNYGVLYDTVFETFWPIIGPDATKDFQAADHLADIGEISDREREQRGIEILNKAGFDGEKMLREAYENSHRREDLLDFIRQVRGQYKTALLSNISDNIDRFFTSTERQELFDIEVLSYKIHLLKPDPKIYLLTADRLNLKPGECIFVDDKQSNVDGAEAVGMRGILYQDFAQFRTDLEMILKEENHNA